MTDWAKVACDQTQRAKRLEEALLTYRGVAAEVMSELLAMRTREGLILADKVHRIDANARVALYGK